MKNGLKNGKEKIQLETNEKLTACALIEMYEATARLKKVCFRLYS